MPLIISFLVLVLVIGFPRIYGTELPMALLLIPFYLAGFLQQMMVKGYYSFVFLMLFSLWLIGGIICYLNGDGVVADLLFHLVISVKMLLNLFFGFVVFQVIRDRPTALLWWLVFQVIVAAYTIVSPEFYAVLLGFISPRSADVFQHVTNLRALGFGLFHVDGALLLVVAMFFYIFLTKGGAFRNLLLILMLPISMAMARSAVIPYAVFGVLKRGMLLKVTLVFSVLILMTLSFFVTSGPLFEATEIFRNFIEFGEFRSVSVSGLADMYILPDSIKVYLYGDGKYFSNDPDVLGFHMGTDVGYLRILYFSGLWSILVFFLLNTYYLFPLIFNKKYHALFEVKSFAISLILIFFIVNFKGLQLMPLFSIAFYFYATEFRRSSLAVNVTPATVSQV